MDRTLDVPFHYFRREYTELKNEFDLAYNKVMEGGRYILGEEVSLFEKEFASFIGVKHCIGVGNGLDALRLALEAYGVKSGDEVIVPANTYIATWLAASHCGAIPVPVDASVETYNIDVQKIRSAITNKTKAIIPVHLYSHPAQMQQINELAQEFGIFVLEDAAQSHGSRLNNRMSGALGDAAGFSFYPTKNLGAIGDGGAVTTDNEEIAEKVRVLRDYGQRERYVSNYIGINSRLDELQAALLRVKLKHLEDWNEKRRKIAECYTRFLEDSGVTVPRIPSNSIPNWYIYAIRFSQRDKLMERLKRRGIITLIHYPIPPHLQPAYKFLGYRVGDFPVSEKIAEEELSLPIDPYLNQEEINYVAENVIDLLKSEDFKP